MITHRTIEIHTKEQEQDKIKTIFEEENILIDDCSIDWQRGEPNWL